MRNVDGDYPGLVQSCDEVSQRGRGLDAISLDSASDIGIGILADDLMTLLHRMAGQVAAHAPKSDDSELHLITLLGPQLHSTTALISSG